MNKTAIITGAGTGIGQAIANKLADQGFSLILLGRNLSRLKNTQDALNNASNHQSFSCDIRNVKEIRDALSQSKVDSINSVVVNAGVGGENTYGNGDRWQEIIDTNLTGSYHTVNECLPYLKKDPLDYKKIVFISSILARLGVPGYSGYCASKAGLLGLMRSLANEHTGNKILVNALCPGWVDTDMAQEGLQTFADALSISKEEAYKNAMSQVPLGKMSQPHEIASLVAYLVSEEQTSITGQTLDINGGALMP